MFLPYLQNDKLCNDCNSTTRNLNLKKKRLRIASLTSEPYQHIQQVNESYSIGKGFSFEIVDQLSQHFNFTYDIVVPPDQDFGVLKNGSFWTGLIGMLFNETADMAAAPISITKERQEIVTFSTVLFEDSLGLLLSRPQGRQNSQALVAPFTTAVWIVVIAVAVMVCPILYLLVRLSQYVHQRSNRKKLKAYFTILDCIWFVYSGLIKQGFGKTSTSIAVRLLMASWWLTCILIAAFYAANLTAFLTTENVAVRNNMEEFSSNKWTFKKGTAFSNALLQKAHSETNEGLFFLKESFLRGFGMMVNNDEEAMEQTQNGYAYVQEVNILKHLLYQDFSKRNAYCQFYVLNSDLFKQQTAFAFPRKSPYAIHFSNYMEELRRNGLIQKWMQQHLSKADQCDLHQDYKLSRVEEALSLKEVYTAFYLLIFGLLLGFVMFTFEIKAHAWRTKIRRFKKKVYKSILYK